jgi:fibronectin-binding autotransporter adhesin
MVNRSRYESIASSCAIVWLARAVIGLAFAGPASAADYLWTNAENGLGVDGSGATSWTTWKYPVSGGGGYVSSFDNRMVFGVGSSGTAGTITSGTTYSANGIWFKKPFAGSYNLNLTSTTNFLTLGGSDPTITVDSGVTGTITSANGNGRLGGANVRITGGGTLTLAGMGAANAAAGLEAFGRGVTANNPQNSNTSIVQDGNTTVRYSGDGHIILASDSTSANLGGTGKATYTMKSGTLTHLEAWGGLLVGSNWAADFVQEGGLVSMSAVGQFFNANKLQIGLRSNGSYALSGGTFLAVTAGTRSNMVMSSASPTSGAAPVSSLTISGGSMLLNGDGTMANVTGSSSTVTISGGELALTNLKKGSGTVAAFTFSGGTLRPYDINATFGSTTAGNNFTITLSGTGATFSGLDAAAGTARTATVEALLSGTGRVNINGGTVVFGNASNSYSGATVIAGGSLKLDADATFASSTSVVVGSTGSSGATLDLTAKAAAFAFGSGQTVGGIGSVLMPTNGVSLAGFLAPGDSGIGTLTFTNARTLDLEPAIDAGSNRFLFDLGAGDVSDLVSLPTGTLNIGSGKLRFSDFAFSLSPLSQGTYRLFSASTINGTLTSDMEARKGTITGAYTGELVQGAGYIDLVVVPEPGAVTLVGIGLGSGLVFLRRSRRRESGSARVR